MWFIETPWPPIVIFSVIAAGFGAALVTTQRARYGIGVLAMAVASLVTYVVEENIVTERERVEQAVIGIADAFQDQDVRRTLSFISRRTPEYSYYAGLAVQHVEVDGELRITDLSVDLKTGRAKSHFRANGTFIVSQYGNVGHYPTRWEVLWQKEGDEWKIIGVEQLDPITGEPIDEYLRYLMGRQ